MLVFRSVMEKFFTLGRQFHREAIEVFLKFLKTFSSEKGLKPPEALAAKLRSEAQTKILRFLILGAYSRTSALLLRGEFSGASALFCSSESAYSEKRMFPPAIAAA